MKNTFDTYETQSQTTEQLICEAVAKARQEWEKEKKLFKILEEEKTQAIVNKAIMDGVSYGKAIDKKVISILQNELYKIEKENEMLKTINKELDNQCDILLSFNKTLKQAYTQLLL